MKNFQINKDFWKDPGFILFLILFSFFLREVFLAAVLPIFSGQDEARHYNTIQYLNEPKEKIWKIQEAERLNEKKNLDTYNFSEEIIGAGNAAEIFGFKDSLNKINFPAGSIGRNEDLINSRQWESVNKKYPPDITGKGYQDLYHRLGAFIEKKFSDQSILIRFYLIRIFSVILATIFIFLSYFVFKNAGFSQQHSLVMTAIVSFQMKFSTYMTNINYAPLMFVSFAGFTLGGVLYLKNGLHWKNVSLMLVSIIIGIFTKGSAIVLIPVFVGLLGLTIWKKNKENKISKKNIALVAILCIFLVSLLCKNYNVLSFLPKTGGGIGETIKSFSDYASASLPKIYSLSKNYWGKIGWVRVDYAMSFIWIIWIIEVFALFGIARFLFSKNKKPSFIPERKYIWFFLALIMALQIGIRFFDWRVFSTSGKLDLGTPGRYFLPNLPVHIALLFSGLGMILKKKSYFDYVVVFFLILIFLLSFHTIFNVIVPRYYL